MSPGDTGFFSPIHPIFATLTTISLTTFVPAPPGVVFDASLSVDLHLKGMQHTGERVVAGRDAGSAQQGESITWEARHFGIRQRLRVIIEECDRPAYFRDRMVSGAFRSMVHHHYFEPAPGGTTMRDEFCYEVPFGPFGQIFNRLVLRAYMTGLLRKRNSTLLDFFAAR